MPPEELAELAKIDSVVAVKQANNDELQPIEGLDDSRRQRRHLPQDAGDRRGRGHLRRLAPGRSADARDLGRRSQAGDLERAREIDATLRHVYAAMGVTTNPIPVKAALEMTGLIPIRTP